jgi:hypothetical protein
LNHLKLGNLRLDTGPGSRLDDLKAASLRFGSVPGRLADRHIGDLRLGDIGFRSASRRGKSLAYAGTALALTGLGGVTAAAATSPAPNPVTIAGAARNLGVGGPAITGWGSVASGRHPAAPAPAPAHAHAGAPVARAGGPGSGSGSGSGAGQHASSSGDHAGSSGQHAGGEGHAPAARRSPHLVKHGSRTWKQVRDALASQTYPRARPGSLPLPDRLVIGPASGQQAFLQVTPAQLANATTIVRQALGRHMGLRTAVIAVATAIQESQLQNLGYGDRDSLGLFQQRPSMGWGSASQLTTPSYAADAFLAALAQYQKANPGWAAQPLWQSAQAVQRSGFPYAYAKWETQASQLVSSIAQHVA